MARPADTSADIDRMYFERLRQMSEVERLELARSLTLASQRLAFIGMRERYPEDSDDDIWLRLAVVRLGADVVRKVYGRVPGES